MVGPREIYPRPVEFREPDGDGTYSMQDTTAIQSNKVGDFMFDVCHALL